jgi:hypothetical protein
MLQSHPVQVALGSQSNRMISAYADTKSMTVVSYRSGAFAFGMKCKPVVSVAARPGPCRGRVDENGEPTRSKTCISSKKTSHVVVDIVHGECIQVASTVVKVSSITDTAGGGRRKYGDKHFHLDEWFALLIFLLSVSRRYTSSAAPSLSS